MKTETNTEIIKKIRQSGAKVNISHYRHSKSLNSFLPINFFRLNRTLSDLNSRSGLTFIHIQTKNGIDYHTLVKCHKADNFSSRRGVTIGLQRLLPQLELDCVID